MVDFTSARARRGFTLVELLVVIAIIGVLIALLLPAIQSARESGRKTQCSNNLRQLGSAMHNYVSGLGSFPPGASFGTYFDPPNIKSLSLGSGGFYANAFLSLTPYLEQTATLRLYNPNVSWQKQNPGIMAAVIPTLICPSNSKDNPTTEQFISDIVAGLGASTGDTFGLTDYVLCKGVNDTWCVFPGIVAPWEEVATFGFPKSGFAFQERGMFDLSLPKEANYVGANFTCRPTMIADGLSNTFALGEGAEGPSWPVKQDVTSTTAQYYPGDPTRPLPIYQFWSMPVSITSLADAGLYVGSPFACTLEKLNTNPVTQSVIDSTVAVLICRPSIDWANNGTSKPTRSRTSGFRSDHRGGANFMMADSSVHFISDSIEISVYRGLSTIQGSLEPILLPATNEVSGIPQ
ncbi:MAG: DUF1559 domain-containing protein [Pirellulales bacterium]